MTASHARELFRGAYGAEPNVIASAPGRVNLIGEHTDYNGGDVLPIAIDKRTWVAAGHASGTTSRATSATDPIAGRFDARHPTPGGAWWDYVAGVAAELSVQGHRLDAVDIAVWSDLPSGAGLASSAALGVAAAIALGALAGESLTAGDAALVAWRAESGFVGVSVGMMDPIASAHALPGHALHVRCAESVVTPLPMHDEVLVFDTATPRALRGSVYQTRRLECERALAALRRLAPDLPSLAAATGEGIAEARLPPPLDARARHVVGETARVREAASQLARGESLDGALLLASHESLRALFECSSPELDWFVERAMRVRGIRGARLTGAGWGGCAIAVGTSRALHQVARAVTDEFAQVWGKSPHSWITRASDGARLEHAA